MRPLYEQKYAEKYEAGGRQPLPEHEVEGDDIAFNAETLEFILPHEMLYSYFNHYKMWKAQHLGQMMKFRSVLSRCAGELAEYTKYKVGVGRRAYDMPSNVCRGPALIIGSGESLDEALPKLKVWQGGIVCSTSHASTLTYHGIPPTHIMCFDTRTSKAELDFPHDYKRTTLITWPGIHPEVHDRWKGRMYHYRIFDPAVAFYSYSLPAGYNWITTQMQPLAHSVAMQMAAAHWMGYSPLILVGTDFCYRTKTRFDAWWKRKRKWECSPGGPISGQAEVHIMIHTAGGQVSEYILIHYRRTTVVEAWLDELDVIDCSQGILNGLFPQAKLDDILAGKYPVRGKRMMRDRLEPWLATEHTYFVPMLDGHKLIVAKSDVALEGTLHLLEEYDKLDIPALMARFREMRAEGEKLRADGYYGTAGLRE